MNFDFADFAKGLNEFKNFFTLRHIAVLVFVAAILVLLCAPRSNDNGPVVAQTCSDASCPFPRKDAAVEALPAVTKVAQENWSLDLPGDGWESEEPSTPVMKEVRRNISQECMIILIKEPADVSFGQYIVDSIEGFQSGGAQVTALKQVMLNRQKFVLMESILLGSDRLMAWNSVKDGFGYSLSCFYHPNVDAGTAQYDLCIEIANSLQIK